MTIRLLRYETRRYAAAVRVPLGVLMALAAIRALGPNLIAGASVGQAVDARDPAVAQVGEVVVTVWSVAVIAGLAWLIVRIVLAARQPARDANAAEHLQALRDRAVIQGHELVEIQHTIWATQAGQQAVVVNVGTGQASDAWLPEARLPAGSFALLARDGERAEIAAWASPAQVTATHRHQHRIILQTAALARRTWRVDVAAIRAETETLIRGKD